MPFAEDGKYSLSQGKLLMKKLALLTALTLTTAPLVQADTVLGVYAGFGSWDASFDGTAGKPSIDLNDLGAEDNKNSFYYIALEHPIPLIPNIRLAHTEISSEQTSPISKSFSLGSINFAAGEDVTSEINLTHTDATLYYELLDNWVNLDLGLTARQFDGFIRASTLTKNKKVKIDTPLPMLYGKAQFDLPFSGLSVGIEGNVVSYQDFDVTDYSAKVSYLFDSVLDIGAEAGYRSFSITANDGDLKTDLELKGPYLALIAHF